MVYDAELSTLHLPKCPKIVFILHWEVRRGDATFPGVRHEGAGIEGLSMLAYGGIFAAMPQT